MSRLWYIPLLHDTSDELEHYIDENGLRLRGLGPVSRINILVGATNSGKSRFMRGLIKTPTDKLLSLDPNVPDPNRGLSACWRLARTDLHVQITINPRSREYDPKTHRLESAWLAQQLASLQTTDPETYRLTRGDFTKVHSWLEADLRSTTTGKATNEQRARLKQFMEKFRFFLWALASGQADKEWFDLEGNRPSECIQKDIKLVADFIEAICSANYSTIAPRKVYIPVLRTAVPLREISTSNTNLRFKVDPFVKTTKWPK